MIRSFEKRAEQSISGFKSPAADYLEGRLDIANRIVVDPHATFYFQMEGDAMNLYNIQHEDVLVVDRSLSFKHGAIVIAFFSGTFSCRLYLEESEGVVLKNGIEQLSNAQMHDIQIWGVVTTVCRNVLPKILRKGKYSRVCTL